MSEWRKLCGFWIFCSVRLHFYPICLKFVSETHLKLFLSYLFFFLQLSVCVWMEGCSLLWESVVLWCGTHPTSLLCPRLHLRAASWWVHVPLSPWLCRSLLPARLDNDLTSSYCVIIRVAFSKSNLCVLNWTLIISSCVYKWSLLQWEWVVLDVISCCKHKAQNSSAAAVPNSFTRGDSVLYSTLPEQPIWWGNICI